MTNATIYQTDTIQLAYTPPFDWPRMLNFYQLRAIDGLEYVSTQSYSRSFSLNEQQGWFEVQHHPVESSLELKVSTPDLSILPALITHIRRQFDLDANSQLIDTQLQQAGLSEGFLPGIRLPGIWSIFEAGVRAILGQQVSVKAARNLVTQVVQQLGSPLSLPPESKSTTAHTPTLLFPTPNAIADSDLSFLKMPASRRQSLKNLAKYCVSNNASSPEAWLELRGIGPWTVNYVKLRGLSEPDIFLDSDLGIKHALAALNSKLNVSCLSPWGSYATFQLWSRL